MRNARRQLLRLSVAGLAALAGTTAQADLVKVVAAAKPSVVAVGTYNALESPRFSFRGTGFAVTDGLQVITNFHVLPSDQLPPESRLVVLVPRPGGQAPEVRDVRLRASAAEHDLAWLTIEGAPLPPLPLTDAEQPAPDGQSVAMIGFPLGASLGFTQVTHRGIIAATTAVALPPPTSRQLDARTLARLRQGPFPIYQLDATAYPGNSGSPLLDVDSGLVLGIVNMVFVKGTRESVLTAPSGISYAIPARHIRDLLVGR